MTKKDADDQKKIAKLEELALYNSKLRFCSEQLQNLNFIFQKKLENNSSDRAAKPLLLSKSVTERLVQRLLCSVGALDPRFSSKFLICTNSNDEPSSKLEYIVRIDSLSTPCLYKDDDPPKYTVIERDSDYPAGYARIRLNNPTLKIWSDFVNSSGYLRRDKVQARLVELLAHAASVTNSESALNTDESIMCGSPGKIVDPYTLHRILQIPAEQQVFYGPSGNVPRFPDPRDFKIAIVDEPSGIKLRIEFLSPALSSVCVRVRLLVAVGLDCWPSTSSFPGRVPLGHADCLLYHRAALTGSHLVGYGVQSSGWQIRVPAAEYTLLNHYSPSSTVSTVLDVLYDTLNEINNFPTPKRHQISFKILNRYVMKTVLFHEMERDMANPTVMLINWSPLYLSTLVLKILDRLVLSLKDQKQPSYFFEKANLFVNPGHLCEDDFLLEAEKVQAYLLRLFDESLVPTKGNKQFREMCIAQNTEMLLLFRWKDIVHGLLPPPARRRFCFLPSRSTEEHKYTSRQLEYIGMLLKRMLSVKQATLHDNQWEDHISSVDVLDNPLEDLIYLLVTIIEQARDQYLESLHKTITINKNKSKFKMNFNASTTKLIENLRKDKESSTLDLQDDAILVRTLLRWLHKGLEQSKRYMSPVLKPYLNILFHTSHAASWHLEAIKKLVQNEELDALGAFCVLVNHSKITPAEGLQDATKKNWTWARSTIELVEQFNLRLVFVCGRGKIVRHVLSVTEGDGNREKASKTLQRQQKLEEVENRRSTLPSRNYFNTIVKKGEDKQRIKQDVPIHNILRDQSPLTLLLQKEHRRGDHRCSGDLLEALVSIQKLNVLQDVSTHLLEEDRVELLETIHKLTASRNRRNAAKRWSSTLPQFNKGKFEVKSSEGMQKYTPKEESAGISLSEDVRGGHFKKWDRERLMKQLEKNKNTLIGSCRAARIREDSSVIQLQENFKIKSLMRSNKEMAKL